MLFLLETLNSPVTKHKSGRTRSATDGSKTIHHLTARSISAWRSKLMKDQHYNKSNSLKHHACIFVLRGNIRKSPDWNAKVVSTAEFSIIKLEKLFFIAFKCLLKAISSELWKKKQRLICFIFLYRLLKKKKKKNYNFILAKTTATKFTPEPISSHEITFNNRKRLLFLVMYNYTWEQQHSD